ncbi:MAG: bacillithiol biosynthesis BshC, partial [Bacteroidota bacterium]|nr:bacillithiol biosynthesis BshC [Bacteroidota bacterium]
MINISLENIYSSKFLLDFISRTSTMSGFHPMSNTIGNFKKVIDQKKFLSAKRNVLTQVISEQYLTIGLPVPKNLNLLSESNSFTVTTGHQLCLFGGPQFFIHKIISTISLAEKLKESYPKHNFIPTFWMATEDHDFDEIS